LVISYIWRYKFVKIFWFKVLEPIVKKYKDVKRILKSFVDVDGLLYVYKMVEIHHKKKLNYIVNIYFKFLKNWIRFKMIS